MVHSIVTLISNKCIAVLYLLTISLIFAGCSDIFADDYLITDLGTLGGNWSRASRLNALGEVVGVSINQESMQRGFYWDSFELHDLGVPDGYIVSGAIGINDLSQIAGYANTNYQSQDAFVWEEGNWIDISPEVYPHDGMATDINNSFQVVGYSFILGQNSRFEAWFWKDSLSTNLGSLGGNKTYASAINMLEQVVGWSQTEDTAQFIRHAFIWEDDMISDLGVLAGETSSVAYDINDNQQVCGESSHKQDVSPYLNVSRPCMWQEDEIIDLGLLPGYSGGSATAINNQGQIVGWLSINLSGSPEIAFIYDDGVMYDLNLLIPENSGWVLQTATDINDFGQITGNGIAPNGETHAYLLESQQVGMTENGEAVIPTDYKLISNYPNPFNAGTVISYKLTDPSRVTIIVYDILGREIQTLVSGYHEAGQHQVSWRADGISSGVYFYRMIPGSNSQTGMMTLLK